MKNIKDKIFDEQVYEHVIFENCMIDMNELVQKKYMKCRFDYVDFSELSVIKNCIFDSCEFVSAKLNGIEFINCAFLSCNLKYTNFFAATFNQCKMTGTKFIESNFFAATILGGDFSYTQLRYQEFMNQYFENIRFFGADLTGCKFTKCTLKKCDFSEAIMHESSFYDSDIRQSIINNIDCSAIDLRNAQVDLSQCIAIAENITKVRFVPENE
jgi:uncharacterized protein YjbI with pentapeptide repeats